MVQGGAAIRPWRSPIKIWAWSIFWANAVVSTIFAVLCAMVYQVRDSEQGKGCETKQG